MAGGMIDREAQPLDPADRFFLDPYNAIGSDRDREHRGVFSQGFHQQCGPSVDKTFGQAGVQRIRQSGFDGAGAGGHFVARQDPVGPLADIGPAANRGDAALQRIDVPRHIVEFGDPRRDIVRTQIATAQILPQPRHEARVDIGTALAEIG